MKKSIIIVLQIICLLLMVTNHYLTASYLYFPECYFFGVLINALIIDAVLWLLIGLQLTIIVALIEDKEGEKKRRAT